MDFWETVSIQATAATLTCEHVLMQRLLIPQFEVPIRSLNEVIPKVPRGVQHIGDLINSPPLSVPLLFPGILAQDSRGHMVRMLAHLGTDLHAYPITPQSYVCASSKHTLARPYRL